jgi:hypothetical protein
MPEPVSVPFGSPDAGAGAGGGIGGLAPLKLPDKYKGEEREAGWRAFFDQKPDESPEQTARREASAKTTKIVTKYNSPEEIDRNTLKPREGAGGTKLTSPTGDPASYKGIYAMGQQGEVVGNLDRPAFETVDGQRRNMHHSSLLGGADVTHAGHIGVRGGEVNYLDDDSGHYRPDEGHTKAAFDELASQGVLNPNSATGRVNLVDKTKEKGKGQERGDTASVHFSGYQQAGGSEKGIRAKGGLMKELLAKTPRYEGEPAAEAAGPKAPVESTTTVRPAGGVGAGAGGGSPAPSGAMRHVEASAGDAPSAGGAGIGARPYNAGYLASAAGAGIGAGAGGAGIVPSAGGPSASGAVDDRSYTQATPYASSGGASAAGDVGDAAAGLSPEEIEEALASFQMRSEMPQGGAGAGPAAGYGQYRGNA